METANRFIVLLLAATCGMPSVADVCVYKPPTVRHAAGRVVDSTGRPIPGVSVSVIQGGESVASAKTNNGAEFQFDSLKEGVYEVTATANGFQSARYKVIVSHPTMQWKKALQIQLAVGREHCGGEIKIVKTQ